MVCTPWLPPGGSCHDEISASRNRYFVVTDEGWRWLKVSDFHVGWRKPGHIPSIQLHSLTNLSPPLISLATLSSFPPGEAKEASPQRVANLATPTGLRSFRFSLCTLPGGFGNQRVGTIPVRHCPAALPPAPTDGFYHATNRAVLSAAGICSRLYSLKMFCKLSTPVRIIDSPS